VTILSKVSNAIRHRKHHRDAMHSITARKSEQTGKVEFSLYAPTLNDDGVALIGAFTGGQAIPMEKQKDGTFTVHIDVPDGTHGYKFRIHSKSWFYKIEETHDVCDPYAHRVDEKNCDALVEVKDGEIVTEKYDWQNYATPLAPNHKLVIYELHVPDFVGDEDDPHSHGTFKHVIGRLDYLADLGINAIEMMPIMQFPGDHGWGYAPQHLFAPHHHYGTSTELKQLIDEAHKRGIRVIFDAVFNHAHTETPLAQIDHDYWFHHAPRDPNMSWGPQYNYEHYDEKYDVMPARKVISECIRYWISEYHMDGMRFDAAKQLENYDALRMMSDVGREAAGTKPYITIAEYLPEDPALVGPPDSGRPMDSTWQDRFFWNIADGILTNKPVDISAIKEVINPLSRGFGDLTQVVNYISNHDHRRLMPRLASEAGIFHEFAFARANLASTILLTSVGIPMLWMGEEFAEYKPKSTEPSKLDWTLLNNQINRDLFNHYKTLIKLRKENEALSQNQIEFFFEDAAQSVLAYHRWSADDKNHVVVIANFKDVPHENYHISNFPRPDSDWHNWIADRHEHVDADGLHTSLGGLEARVLVWPAG
jgi:1,4-alpha-glucan branching enzyme